MTNPHENQPEPDRQPGDADRDIGSGGVRPDTFGADFDAEQTIRLDHPSDAVDSDDVSDHDAVGDSDDTTSDGSAETVDGESDEGAEPTVALASPSGSSGSNDSTGTTDSGGSPEAAGGSGESGKKKVSAATIVIAVLVGLLGFALIVQVRGTSEDSTLASARTDDLVRILSDLDSNENRVRQEIADLEQLKRELTAGSESAEAARGAAEQRADELGILAGTLPAEGTGLTVRFSGQIRASRFLDAVEELRNAGAEAMQISGGGGPAVRIIVSTYFQDADGGLNVSGTKLTGPYTITVIGDPATMKTALNIPGGVVATVSSDGGNVIVEDPGKVTVSALAAEPDLQYAQPAS
ncbi:uncharacterized protein YlxW (UPF0749 family) [Hamadaea flava]|uniref:DUF881 domain-containing protein n=1 Tax=Hamadaea flava TaxID=1742688 RepID=A0ABV8LRK8_9ACTN|nr:DUF881 domain-containing protein [Hamadaea flava]MCP2321853.1 uncharacterized protein YlxW (UPF0749 family) [Hamadaea flava]